MSTRRRTPTLDRSAGGKGRDAERSRISILDAAEQLFAELGFTGASLAAIADKAGVSVGLPGYFFGSKEDLHREVLHRVFERRDAALDEVVDAAETLLAESPDDAEGALRKLVGGYVEFLLTTPTFVWLLTRDAIERAGDREVAPRHSRHFAERMVEIMTQIGVVGPGDDSDQLVLSVIGMCYFPLEHDATIVAGMGQRAWSRTFQEKRVDHIVRLLMAHR